MAGALSRSGRSWFAVLGPPLLWFVQLNVNYQWEEVGACSPSATHRGVVFGIGVRTLILLVNAAAIAGVFGALAGALRDYRRTEAGAAGDACTAVRHGDVAHWMALVGIINSTLFGLLIIVGFAPPILLKTCQTPL